MILKNVLNLIITNKDNTDKKLLKPSVGIPGIASTPKEQLSLKSYSIQLSDDGAFTIIEETNKWTLKPVQNNSNCWYYSLIVK